MPLPSWRAARYPNHTHGEGQLGVDRNRVGVDRAVAKIVHRQRIAGAVRQRGGVQGDAVVVVCERGGRNSDATVDRVIGERDGEARLQAFATAVRSST